MYIVIGFEVLFQARKNEDRSKKQGNIIFNEFVSNRRISYDYMSCCIEANIRDECINVCDYKYSLNFLTLNFSCYSEINKLMECGSKGFNYQTCCSNNGVPKNCLGLCNHEVDSQQINMTFCATYIQSIVKCYEEIPCNPERYKNRFCEKENNFESCGYYDEGDCRTSNNTMWPKCPHNPLFIGDGICDDHLKDNSECNHDGGDCCDRSLWGNKMCDEFNNFNHSVCKKSTQFEGMTRGAFF